MLMGILEACLGLVILLSFLSCSPVATSPPAATVALDYASASNPCALRVPPPKPTPGPPTPSPTPPPTSPFAVEDFPPYIDLPDRPIPELPVAAQSLTSALVSIAIQPPADHDSSASFATGLLVSADGLVLTVLDYTRPMQRIEVVLPGRTTLEASIERVDPRTGATLLKIDGSDLPYSEVSSGVIGVSPGEPVLLLGQLPEREEILVREGFAAPATNEEVGEILFALLPVGSMGSNGSLVVNREGKLLGMAGPGQSWGASLRYGFPYPGPPRPAVKTTSIQSFLKADIGNEFSTFPAAASYRGQNWGWEVDLPATRELLDGPTQEAMNSLGGTAPVDSLGQDPRSILGYGPGSVLELVYARPQELRASNGELLGIARYVAFWWDREGGKPDVVLCGAEPENVGAAFLSNDLAELKAAAAAAPESGHSLVDFSSLPGYPDDYPLKWQVSPNKETYLPGEEVKFTITIENLSDWPIIAYPIPPALEIVQVGGPGPVPWWQHQPGDTSQIIPARQELKVFVTWPQVGHEGSPMPPGDYRVSALYSTARATRVSNGGGRFTIAEE